MKNIEIANPAPGGAKRTSAHQAERYIRRGDAVMLASGRLLIVERRVDEPIKESTVRQIAVVDRWRYPHTQWITA